MARFQGVNCGVGAKIKTQYHVLTLYPTYAGSIRMVSHVLTQPGLLSSQR